MATNYPSAIQTFTDPTGSDTLASPDHATLHVSLNDTLEALQNTVGTTAGTNVLKNFATGDLAVRINSSNVLQQPISGTITNPTFGSPSITGGTANNIVLGTPTLIGVPNHYAHSKTTGTSITSTSFVAMDATNLTGTIVTSNSNYVRVMLTIGDMSNNSGANPLTTIQIVRNPSGTPGTVARTITQEQSTPLNRGFSLFAMDTPTSGTNVYQVQWKTSAGTASVLGQGGIVNYSVEEVLA